MAAAGHHAILPTGQVPSSLPEREAQVYDLIVRRILASLLPAGEDERTTIHTEAAGESFVTRGTAVVTPGWRIALPSPKPTAESEGEERVDEEGEAAAIPPGLQAHAPVTVREAAVTARETKAPPRLNDASLLALMEQHGLGTPATRARIVEVLIQRGYVTRERKALVSTEKGRALLQVVPDAIQSPDLTGQWEARLEAIAAGQEDPTAFLDGIRAYTRDLVEAARNQAHQPIDSDLGPCPVCGQGRIVVGKKAWGCSRWREGCRFTIWKTIARKRLTEAQVKTLLAGKTTGELKGFKSKAGKAFSARLKLEGDRVTFVFDPPHRAPTARGRRDGPEKKPTARGAKSPSPG